MRIRNTFIFLIVVLIAAGLSAYFANRLDPGTRQTDPAKEIVSTIPDRSQDLPVATPDCGSLEDELSLPFVCSTTLSSAEGLVDVSMSADGALTVSRDGVMLIRFENVSSVADMNGLVVDAGILGDSPTLAFGTFRFVDINFDGVSDLEVVYNRAAYNIDYRYYLYDTKKRTFNTKPVLEGINTEFDPETKTMRSFYKGRGLADIYTEKVYRFEDGKYVLVEETQQDFAEDDESSGYIYTEKKLENGKMTTVKRKHLTKEEVLGE